MRRLVLPEKLDFLAENDPGALASRRDLRRLNRLAGNHRWIVRSLRRVAGEVRGGVEWAAGDGSLGPRVARSFPGLALTGVDRCSRPACWPAAWPWWQGDLMRWAELEQSELVVGNLILHQFEAAPLARLGRALQRNARVLIFNETWRSPFALAATRLLPLLGAHAVTRHDADLSVRAGFRDAELPQLLGLDPNRWSWTVRIHRLGFYRLLAVRREVER